MTAHPMSFGAGFSLGNDRGFVVAQIDLVRQLGSSETNLMDWSADEGWRGFEIPWVATRVWVVHDQGAVFVIGPAGLCWVVAQGRHSEEAVDDSDEGPRYRGDLRDLRWIGEHLYTAGMSRQVYRREASRSWVRMDDGVVQPLGNLEVVGFNSIDGCSESDLWAVGFRGEIWRCLNGQWHEADSPTNVILHRVRTISQDLTFACGQKGVLLRRRGDMWEIVDHSATDEDLWGMEWFQDNLYVASASEVYRLGAGDELEPVLKSLGKPWTSRDLHGNRGALWSFGPKHIAWTEDGQSWHDVTP
jgi:hypothetical protein